MRTTRKDSVFSTTESGMMEMLAHIRAPPKGVNIKGKETTLV